MCRDERVAQQARDGHRADAAGHWRDRVGNVRGFAFTLGLSTLLDIVVVFLFTRPVISLCSRFGWFSRVAALLASAASPKGRSALLQCGTTHVR